MFARLLVLLASVGGIATASPLLLPRSSCDSYVIISTRGTGEAQGLSSGFSIMNSQILAQLPNGSIYDTVYPAGINQNSSAGTTDIVNQVTTDLSINPAQCFILEGYSQGAAATVDALPLLTGPAFDAVKGVFLIGNPDRKAGLACNVDAMGRDTTKYANGFEAQDSLGIPSNWVDKTLDVCKLVGLLIVCRFTVVLD